MNQNENANFQLFTLYGTRSPLLINTTTIAQVQAVENGTILTLIGGATSHIAETWEKVIPVVVTDKLRADSYMNAWRDAYRKSA